MTTLSKLHDNIATKSKALDATEARMKNNPSNAAEWLQARLRDEEFVLFCGAGISVPPPASAPAFVALRNALVLALADLLLERGLLSNSHRTAVETAIEQLETRADLEMPPEHVFGLLRKAQGFDMVSRLLVSCLDRGQPNENHLAIRHLARTSGLRLKGVITANFDLYIEQALQGTPFRRSIVNDVESGAGFPLYKPHGSLDRPDSIAITIERVAHPLKGAARQTFKDLTSGRIVLVIGYSGWDYDLFPMLVHAGRKWGSEIAWVLYDDTSMNERTAKIQLALQARCTILNSRRKPLLPVLAGITEPHQRQEHEAIRRVFTKILGTETDDALASALIGVVTPSGVPASTQVVKRLCAELLRIAERNRIKDDTILFQRLGLLVAWSEDDPPIQRQAAQFAVECARRLHREPAVREFQRIVDGEQKLDDPESRLQRLERELDEFPFAFEHDPYPALAERSIRADLRIEKAELLMELKRHSEAETFARQILSDTHFPKSGVSEDAWIVDDGHARWRLHNILGSLAFRRKDFGEAQAQFCEAIDLLWHELELWELDSVLRQVAYDASRQDPACVEAAMDFNVRIARFSRDPYSELHALEWKLDYGVGDISDLERAEALLEDLKLEIEDQKEHRQILHRLRKRLR